MRSGLLPKLIKSVFKYQFVTISLVQVQNTIKHLAVIMDGNRRWAKQRSLASIEGHRAGVQALKKLVSLAPSYGIQHLTVYAFSTENWKREVNEVNFLFELLAEVALQELSSLKEKNVRVSFIGNLTAFTGTRIINNISKLVEATNSNTGLHLQIALNYGSLDELNTAIQRIKTELDADQIVNLTESGFEDFLYTQGTPDPDIVVRTGGEQRLSNFLLWQAANARLSFIETLWPDFDEDNLKMVLNGTN